MGEQAMTNYILNLRLWWTGWHRFDELTMKEGWTADGWGWKLLYLFDYGACCLILGGPVVSVSWYLGAYWGFEGHHFANAGLPLWGSVRSEAWVRVWVPVAWLLLIWLAL
jgi:hypothetical protein